MRQRLAPGARAFHRAGRARGRRRDRADPRARRIHLLQHERPERVPHARTGRSAAGRVREALRALRETCRSRRSPARSCASRSIPTSRPSTCAARYRLVNRTGVPIDSVHVYRRVRTSRRARSSFDRAAEPVLADDGGRLPDLRARAAARSRATRCSSRSTSAFRPRGFPNGGIQTDVVRNGTYFDRTLAAVHRLSAGVRAVRRRGAEALRPRAAAAHAGTRRRRGDGSTAEPFRDADRVHVETIIGTAADQIAVTPGVLRRSWTENGRRYFHYADRAAGRRSARTVFSGEYAVLEDRWNDVALQHLPPPGARRTTWIG